MKKIHSFLACSMLGVILAAVPVKSLAYTARTVNVVANSTSGIANATFTATLDDGTILGFDSNAYFCGAISRQTELSIPDSISGDLWFFDMPICCAVKQIGYNSNCDFSNAPNVTSLILPATVTDIDALPSVVKVLHTNGYIATINTYQLSDLDRVLVPETELSSYYENAYWRNYVLINVEGTEPLKITINMTKAGEFAQLLLQQTDNWYKVNELTVVGDLNTDDLNVFKRMEQLTKLDLSRANIIDIPDKFNGANSYTGSGFCILKDLILPEINHIGDYAFAGCRCLKNIIMPKVNTIGNGAFSNSPALQIILPEGVSSIGSYAFYNSSLKNVSIPSSITEISGYCFQSCDSLKSITIPSTVTKIGEYSFQGTGLTSVNLPGVQTIGQRAFYDCQQLTEVKFAEGLTSLGSEVFRGCTALTEIDLPSTLFSMTSQAFGGCTNIKKVTSRAVIPPAHNDSYSILNGCDMTGVKLYVPAMSIDKYRVESGWKTFYTILPMKDKTSNIHINEYAMIDDASQFTDDCNMTIDWVQKSSFSQYSYSRSIGYYTYSCGALDYNGSSTLSIHDYKQYHHLGQSNNENPYSYNAHFTSLIPNGNMRADNVQTILETYSDIWYFISLPYDVKVSDIGYTDDTQFVIRKYSGSNRAQMTGDTWVNLTVDSTMHAYEGYILRCNKTNVKFTFPAINNPNKNKVFEQNSVVMPLGEHLSEFEHNRSWNLIGNPYPCYYDTRFMDFTAPITVWNRSYNRYDAYSPVDDSYILHPSQAFFVQRPVDQTSITFDKSGRQHDAAVRTLPALVKSRAPIRTDRKIYNIAMSDGTVEDHTRFVINVNASCAYELDKDASKFIDNHNTSMLVYTIENGVRYAINERPMSEGVVALGFYAPADGEYTLSLNTTENENIILIDHATNQETVMAGDYHFNARAGYHDARFSLHLGDVTGITEIDVDNHTVSVNAPYSVYTIDGRLVGNYSAGDATNLSKGIYIINSKNAKRKIVVK